MFSRPNDHWQPAAALLAAGLALLLGAASLSADTGTPIGDGQSMRGGEPVRVREPFHAEVLRVEVRPPLGWRPEPSGEGPVSREEKTTPAGLGDLQDVTLAWKEAWAAQQVETYLSFYSAEFDPGGDTGLGEWRSQRRERLTAPDFIEVELLTLGVRRDGPERGSVRFTQRYRSDLFESTVNKRLDLVWEDSVWKIVREVVEPPDWRPLLAANLFGGS